MVIWAKLTQGNDRGTCCWITHILFDLLAYNQHQR